MKYLAALMCALCASFTGAQTFSETGRLSDYRLGSGDVLSIVVFGEPDLTFDQITVSDAGTIIYPLLGELELGGRSIGGAADLITELLKDGWLVSPSVNIRVVKYRQFFIHGEVTTPGGYDYQPGLTLQQAVALAGGFTARASRNRFELQPEGTGVTTEAALTTLVSPGDTIVIRESFF